MINQQDHRGTRQTPCLGSSGGPASKDVRGHYAAPVTAFRAKGKGQKAQTHHNTKFYSGGFPTHKIKKLVLRVKSKKNF